MSRSGSPAGATRSRTASAWCPSTSLWWGRGEARRRVRQTASEIGVEVALDVEIERIGLAERQLGEVVIAVAQGARVLLLDEPTSTLGPSEVERLMRTVRQLAERGVAIGLVTHRISEVITAADDVTVLRAGELVHDGSAAELDPVTIARMMVGDRITRYENGRRREPGPTVVQVASVHTEHGDHIVDLDDVSLEVRAGEIVGIAGVVGSGQVALADVLSGVRHPARGTVRVDGHDVTGDAATATHLGVAYIPESRDDGLHPVGTVAENASLLEIAAIRPAWRRRDRKAERAHGVAVCERFEVRPPDPDLPTVGLSGGNRQKLLVGRELIRGPRVVIAHGPTQGLDLAAGAAVRRELVAAAEQGAAVLVVSADLDEVLELADRVVVLAAGRVADELVPGDDGWDLDRLGAAMAGMNQEAR